MLILLSAIALMRFGAPAATFQGRAIAWGDNGVGQTNVPADLTNIIAVASGYYHGLALRVDGTVEGWGENSQGQASPPDNLSDVVAISAGAYHSIALRSNGRVVAWGDNSSGQTNVPAGLTSVWKISAGQYHNLALRSNGTVVAWGSGPGTNVPPNLQASAIAAGGNHSLALRADGTVAGWGQNTFGQANTAGLSQILGITAGGDFSAVILSDRTVFAWGNPALGRTAPPAGLAGVVRLEAGVSHCLALRNNRRVVAWGDNTSGQASVPTNFTTWLGMGGGFSHSVGLVVIPPTIVTPPQSQTVNVGANVNFTVGVNGSAPLAYRWRKNGAVISGETSSTLSVTGAQTNDSGNYSVIVTNLSGAVTSAVAVLTVNASPGIVTPPQSTNVGVGWTNIFRVTAAGTAPLRYRWRHAGTNIPNATNAAYTNLNVQHRHAGEYVVVVTNNYGAITSAVATLTVIDAPAILSQPRSQTVLEGGAVNLSVVATNVDGYQWRLNGQFVLGANGPVYSIQNAQTNHSGNYSVLLTNRYGSTMSHTSVLAVFPRGSGQGEVVGWGESNIWDGSDYVDLTPPALNNVAAISAGVQHSIVRFRNGTVLAWGVNTHGQSGSAPGLSNVVEIAAGGFHNLARTASGLVVGWGLDEDGQSSVPSDLPTNIVALAAGGHHSLALKSDGTVVGWGKSPQRVPPPGVDNVARISAGADHSLVVRSNSTVTGWGTNNFGQAFPPAGLNNVIAIAAGENHSLALRNDGTVVAWGANNLGQTNVPPGLAGVIAIASGANHSLALRSDHTVVAWGHNNFRQTDVPPNLPPVIAIVAGGDRSLALVRASLRLRQPQHVAADQIRIAVETSDGSFLSPERAQGVEVYYTPDLGVPPSNWPKLPVSLDSSIGSWSFADGITTGPRFYLLLERP